MKVKVIHIANIAERCYKTLKAKRYQVIHISTFKTLKQKGSYRFTCGVCAKGYNEERKVIVNHQKNPVFLKY